MGDTTLSKICRVCGVDVSNVKRFKDQHGSYYCGDCWALQQHALDASNSDAQSADVYRCHVCRGGFPLSDVYSEPDGQTICKSCWQSKTASRPRKNRELPEGLELIGNDEPSYDGVLPGGLELVEDENSAAVGAELPGGLEMIEEADPFSALATLPPALEPEAPVSHRSTAPMIPQDAVFCEQCGQYFPIRQMVQGADRSVLCRACVKQRAAEAKRSRRAQSNFPGATAPPPLNYYARQPGGGNIRAIGMAQRRIIWVILGSILFGLSFAGTAAGHSRGPVSPEVAVTLGLLRLGVAIAMMITMYQLVSALGHPTSTCVICALGTAVPCIGLLVLLKYNQDATRVLRGHGIKVGLLGAKAADLPSA